MRDEDNCFDTKEDIVHSFQISEAELADAQIHYAFYSYESYSGEAFLIYSKEDKLYEVHASHCSCNGLENQFDPEETTWEAISVRDLSRWPGLDEVLTHYLFERDILSD